LERVTITFTRNKVFFLLLLIVGTACSQQSKKQEEASANTKEKSEAFKNLVKYGIDTNSLIPQGLAKGDQAPNFKARTQRGDSINLTAILNKQPVVLMFYRGQWCPVCNKYLERINDSVDLIRKAGAKILAITPETAPNAAKMRQKTNTSLTIIPDTSQSIMDDYQVGFDVSGAYARKIENGFDVSIASNNGDQKARLPIPATYIINKKGKITWRFFNPNYKKRASVRSILKALHNSTGMN
jgi:peroxiredoxin